MPAVAKIQMPDDEAAEEVAIEILIWMGNKLDYMERFLAISGIPAEKIRELIGHRSFYAGLFAFLTNHEPTLMDFCVDREIPVEWVVACGRCFEPHTLN